MIRWNGVVGSAKKETATQVGKRDLDENEEALSETSMSTLRQIIGWYQHSASIHGVTHTGGPKPYAYRGVVWLILVSAMAVNLSVAVFYELEHLASMPIKTTTRATMYDTLPFPAVTICNMNQYHRDRVPDDEMIKKLIHDVSEYSMLTDQGKNKTADLDTMADVSGDDLLNMSLHAAHTIDEMFMFCEWRTSPYHCEDLFTPIHTHFGTCFVFNNNRSSPFQTSDTGIWAGLHLMINIDHAYHYFSRVMMAGIKVIVHEQEAVTLPRADGWSIRPGVAASIGLSRKENTMLPLPYKAYKNGHCVDMVLEGEKHSLKRFPSYSRATCYLECQIDKTVNTCGCRFFNDPGNETICSAKQTLTCYMPMHYQTSFEDVVNCPCPPECKVSTYSPVFSYADGASDFIIEQLVNRTRIEDPNYFRKNIIDLRIYFDSLTVIEVAQEPEKTLNTILGSLGGQMGLFLGASILSITELIEMLIIILFKCCPTWPCRGSRKNQAAPQKD